MWGAPDACVLASGAAPPTHIRSAEPPAASVASAQAAGRTHMRPRRSTDAAASQEGLLVDRNPRQVREQRPLAILHRHLVLLVLLEELRIHHGLEQVVSGETGARRDQP